MTALFPGVSREVAIAALEEAKAWYSPVSQDENPD
jgi:hypothetical protein